MKILRWIFGFPIAATIAFGTLLLVFSTMDNFSDGDRNVYVLRQFLVCLVIIIDFSLWVFLTCLFIPSNKRVAGIIPLAITVAFIVFVIWNVAQRSSSLSLTRSFQPDRVPLFLSVIFSPAAGYLVSYFVFRNNGWRRARYYQTQQKDLAEIYDEQVNADQQQNKSGLPLTETEA